MRFAPAFVTPAFGRLDLSAVVLDQRAAMLRELRDGGIDARAYVVADDGNLDLAWGRGLDVVERGNGFLGAKFNDGIEAAVLDGATHVVPIGSDSWLVPEFVRRVDPSFPGVTSGRPYGVVDEAGRRLALLTFGDGFGVGPHFVPTSLLSPPYRPVEEDLASGCDASLLASLERTIDESGEPRFRRVPLRLVCVGPAQYVGFRTRAAQMNPYESLVGGRDVAVVDPWKLLAKGFPPAIVERARAVYERRRAEAA